MSQTSAVKIFAPDPTILGSLADWELQTGGNPSLSRNRAQALKSDGDELASAQYGAKVEYVHTYNPTRFTGDALALPKLGAILNGAHVDSVSVAYSHEVYPILTVNAHRHAAIDGTTETHEACRTYTPSVAISPRAVGVPPTLKDADGTAIFTCPAAVGMASLTYSATVTHLDVPDGDGNHLAGENRDGEEKLVISFTGEVYPADLNVSTAWALPDSWSLSQSNVDATTTSLTLTRHIAHDATA